MADDKRVTSEPKVRGAMIPMGERGLAINTLEDAYRFSQYVVASGLAPAGDTAEKVLVKLQACKELGVPPMRGLALMAVVEGKLSIMGELALALIRNSGLAEYFDVMVEGEGDERVAVARFKRFDAPKAGEVRYSVKDAKTAKLWLKKSHKGYDTPWITSPEDMLIWKAVSRAQKRYFSDATMGYEIAEVARDYAPIDTDGPAPRVAPTAPDPLMDAVQASVESIETVAEPSKPVEPPSDGPPTPEPAQSQPRSEAISPEADLGAAEPMELELEAVDPAVDEIPVPDADTQSAIDAVQVALEALPPKKADYLTARFCEWQEVKVWHHCRDIEALKQLYADAKETANRGRKLAK